MSKARQLPLLIYLTTIGMEICYLYLWLALLRKHLEFGLPVFALILALYPLSFFVKLLLTKLPGSVERSLLFSAILATAIVSVVTGLAVRQTITAGYPVAGVVFQIIFSGVFWWLGYTLARSRLAYHYICFRFQGGILAMLAVLIFGGVEATTFPPVALFFTFAVLSLALARWETSRAGSVGTVRPFSLGSIVLGSGVVLLLSVSVFLTLSPDAIRAVLHWLATAVISFFNLLELNRAAHATVGVGLLSCSFQPPPEESESGLSQIPPPSDNMPIHIGPISPWVAVAVIFIGVLVLFFLAVRWLRARRQAEVAEMTEVETVSLPASLLVELTALLKEIMKRLWHLWQFILRWPRFVRFGLAPVPETMTSVRGVYFSLLLWGAGQGIPRAPWQTPLEYLKVLCQKFPQEDAELALITSTFLQARYSSSPPTDEIFAMAKRAWQQVKSASKTQTLQGH